MYEIYINDTPILLVNEEVGKEKLPGDEKNLVARYTGKPKILLNYADMLEKSQRYNSITIYWHDVEALFADFQTHYGIIEAAGGLVRNEESEVLLIFRRDYWDLPKGKIDPGETSKETAVREVGEETGLTNVELGDFICHTYHTYKNRKGNRKLKRTYWYHMTTKETDLKLQHEEDIEKGEWVKIDDFFNSKMKAYRNIFYVLEMGNQIKK